jgi:hypothetical protein
MSKTRPRRELQTNARSPRQVARAVRTTDDRQRHADDLMGEQLSTPAGRELIWGELQRHGLYDDVAVAGEVGLVYAFIGRRRAGLELLERVMRHPQAYLLMQKEAMARDAQEAAANEAAHAADANEGDGVET